VILTSSAAAPATAWPSPASSTTTACTRWCAGACYSSCANYLFFAGATKTVEPGGMIGFHGWPRIATAADRERVAAAIQRRRPQATEAEIDVAFEQFQAKSAADMALQADFYQRIGSPRLPRLMRILDADPVDYPTGAALSRRQAGDRADPGDAGALLRGQRHHSLLSSRAGQRIDWASDRAPTSGADLQLVWDPRSRARLYGVRQDRVGSPAQPGAAGPAARAADPAARAGAQRSGALGADSCHARPFSSG
jgi:hypothetical protein